MVSFHLLMVAASTLMAAPVWGIVNYQAPEFVSDNGFLDVVLNITMEFSLNGTRFSPLYNAGPVGPTLRVRPGDLLTVTLNNNLPPSPSRDIELLRYIQDPKNEIDDYVNVTKIYNRLDEIGNTHSPEFGFWGFNLANLHFHGAGFPPSLEDLQHPLDGGESRTFSYTIPEDHPPGLVWYHSHVHGVGEYEMMSGLFGAMIIEGTANDVTVIPEIGNATEVIMM
jgi:FtsP/CotA-like multicopper oxidase with cupredoxin domain